MKIYIKSSYDYYGDHEEQANYFNDRFAEEYPDLSKKITYDISMMDSWNKMYFDFKYSIPGMRHIKHKYGEMMYQDSIEGKLREKYPNDPSEEDLISTYENLIHGNFIENLSRFVNLSDKYVKCVNDVISYYENINKKYNCRIALDIYLDIYDSSLDIGIECNSTTKLDTAVINNFNFNTKNIIEIIDNIIFNKFNVDNFSDLARVSDICQTMIEILYSDYTPEWRRRFSDQTDLEHSMNDIDNAIEILNDDLNDFDCVYQLQQADFDNRYYFLVISSYDETEKIKKYVNDMLSDFTDLNINYSRGTSYQLEKEWGLSRMIEEYEEEYM